MHWGQGTSAQWHQMCQHRRIKSAHVREAPQSRNRISTSVLLHERAARACAQQTTAAKCPPTFASVHNARIISAKLLRHRRQRSPSTSLQSPKGRRARARAAARLPAGGIGLPRTLGWQHQRGETDPGLACLGYVSRMYATHETGLKNQRPIKYEARLDNSSMADRVSHRALPGPSCSPLTGQHTAGTDKALIACAAQRRSHAYAQHRQTSSTTRMRIRLLWSSKA